MRSRILLSAAILVPLAAHDDRPGAAPARREEARHGHLLRHLRPRRLPLARGLERSLRQGLERGPERFCAGRSSTASLRSPRSGERVQQIATFRSPTYTALTERGGLLFAIKNEPPKQQPFLVTLKSADDPASERIVVDPNAIDSRGATSIDFYVPSLDGRLVAVSLSEGGSEAGSRPRLRGRDRAASCPTSSRASTAARPGGDVAWTADGSGFFYTRYPRPGRAAAAGPGLLPAGLLPRARHADRDRRVRPRQGLPANRRDDASTASRDGRFVLATVKNGDGGEVAQYLLGPGETWTQVAAFADEAVEGQFGPDGALYLLSRKNAPRGKILRLAPGATALDGATHGAVSEGAASIDDFLRHGAPASTWPTSSAARRRCASSTPTARPPARCRSCPSPRCRAWWRSAATPCSSRTRATSSPSAWYRTGPDGKVARTGLFRTSPVSFADTEVVRETATSRDGTRVPVTILRRKGTRHRRRATRRSSTATAATASASGRSTPPDAPPLARAGRRLRGGEPARRRRVRRGLAPRRQRCTRKQNVFDDFIACARLLIEARYTRPASSPSRAASNGGLLMGAALTQHPELFRAVVSHVGIYDMLRVELSSNGAFNITEFGTRRRTPSSSRRSTPTRPTTT